MLSVAFLFGFLVGNGMGLMIRAITGGYRLVACTALAIVAGIGNALAGPPGAEHFYSVFLGIVIGVVLGAGAGQFAAQGGKLPTVRGLALGYAQFLKAFVGGVLHGSVKSRDASLSGVWVSRSQKLAGVGVWFITWWLVTGSRAYAFHAWFLPGGFLLGLMLYLEGVQSGVVASLGTFNTPPALPPEAAAFTPVWPRTSSEAAAPPSLPE
ncbi:MAG: hypothetical protein U0836_06230 [Pirellulales bacterium]